MKFQKDISNELTNMCTHGQMNTRTGKTETNMLPGLFQSIDMSVNTGFT